MTNQAFKIYQFQTNRQALAKLTDYELITLLENASRGTVRCMANMSMRQIEGALGSLGIDANTEKKDLGDKRKKTTLLKAVIGSLSEINRDMNKAIDELSYYLGLENPESFDADELIRFENTQKTVDETTIAETIQSVEDQIEVIKTVEKRVTKAQQKLEKQLILNSNPPEIRWESDFMGVVKIETETREFWVENPYKNPVVNLVTSNGMVILSGWDTTKDNPFMIAVLKGFQELMNVRAGMTDIQDRLYTISIQLLGSKKRKDWYAQSHESIVLLEGHKMEKKFCGINTEPLCFVDGFDFSKGASYYKAQHYARKYPNTYAYVEGFALADNRIFYHAWLQDRKDGRAIDVTLYDVEQLYGIILDIKWVDKVIASRFTSASCSLNREEISGRYRFSIIEGNFLDDFSFLKSGTAAKQILSV